MAKEPAGVVSRRVAWREADVDAVCAFVRRCLGVDGGLPLAAEPWFVESRWVGARAWEHRSSAGRILAAGALRVVGREPRFLGLVDPDARGQGLGPALLDAALEAEPGVTVESETLTTPAARLFRGRGLHESFAEDVLRLDRRAPPPQWPRGVVLVPWDETVAPRFHAVYVASFAGRPGFPDPPARAWIDELASDVAFRPAWSFLAVHEALGDVGFVTGLAQRQLASVGGWVDQVGVIPAARRSGLASALLSHTAQRMLRDAVGAVWLTVGSDNPAARLYRRLGFVAHGRRARFSS